jgi:hypothetical protein
MLIKGLIGQIGKYEQFSDIDVIKYDLLDEYKWLCECKWHTKDPDVSKWDTLTTACQVMLSVNLHSCYVIDNIKTIAIMFNAMKILNYINPEIRDFNMEMAVDFGRKDILQWCLDHGAEPNQEDFTLATTAIEYERPDILDWLIEKKIAKIYERGISYIIKNIPLQTVKTCHENQIDICHLVGCNALRNENKEVLEFIKKTHGALLPKNIKEFDYEICQLSPEMIDWLENNTTFVQNIRIIRVNNVVSFI